MKTNLIRIAVLFAVLFTTTIAFAGTDEVTLTDEMQAQIDQLVLDSKFAEADTLESTFKAQLRTEKRNNKRIADARTRLEKTWHAEVSPDSMTYDKVWNWADTKDKAIYLSKRYNVQLDADNLDLTGMIDVLRTEINKRQADRAINNKINSAVAQSEAKTNERITDLETRLETAEGEIGTIRYAVNQLGYDMGAAFSFGEHVKHVSDKPSDDNLELIQNLRRAHRNQAKPLLEDPADNNKTDNK